MALSSMDLFSGCGGLSRGLKDAGFSVLAAVEVDRKAQATYRMNHPEVALYESDIRALDADVVRVELGLLPGELDLMAGCPPCQGFSRLRTKNKNSSVEDHRNDLVSDFQRFVRAFLPKTVMLENVPALGRDGRFEKLKDELKNLGYAFVDRVLNASDYGVPQRRRRLILLASRVHVPVLGESSNTQITVRQAIGALDAPSRTKDSLHAVKEARSATVRKMISLVPKDGGSQMDLPQRFRLACHRRSDGFRDVYGRMKWDDVAPTITSGCHNPSKGRFLHPSRNRTITLREAAVLQGFPVDYAFDVSHGKEAIALMIGNALPPPFIAAHAESLRLGIVSSTL